MTRSITLLMTSASTLALSLPAHAAEEYFIGVLSAQSGYLAP